MPCRLKPYRSHNERLLVVVAVGVRLLVQPLESHALLPLFVVVVEAVVVARGPVPLAPWALELVLVPVQEPVELELMLA